ncbi:SRPBCC domain-containing protein [Actinoplanes bogorensis]|uniref:SRPBCC domain-containing protein n=1 Tax=Paractinoplanes bogorensis TaxID=1610840 RepID=A0ABS5YRY2_9ACTN|nr:SRPBCC domain-containing protein [Actinoplanes bogorensis]MBU2666205.1 SRPBCC domain-containing protein [Actinoplanes bogorensis]
MTARSRRRGDELIAERHLDATPERVWTAFTTATGIAAFWGGSHAVVPPESVTVDLRPGGSFALDTLGGRRLRFVYVGIDPPRELVFDEPVTGLRTTVSLRRSPSGTHLTVHQRKLPPELQTAQAADGLASILDALADYLEK